jgi:hypothetical protein
MVCARPVLAATIGGLDKHVDTATLNETGELIALLSGCRTYELHGDELVQRSAGRIGSSEQTAPVVADHRCGRITPINEIDAKWSAVAAAMIVRALGGMIVGRPGSDEAPF